MQIEEFINTIPTHLVRGFTVAILQASTAPLRDRNNNKLYRVGASLYYKNVCVCSKHNKYKTHPKLVHYCTYPTLHAERAIILNYGFDNCENTVMYVVRLNRKNELAMAKPCMDCLNLIKFVGIKHVFFTNNIFYEKITL